MATSTGKKARKSGGTRFACKQAKARTTKRRRFGKLAYSVEANDATAAFEAKAVLVDKVREARQAKTGDPEANVAVEASVGTPREVAERIAELIEGRVRGRATARR